ncbi:MAG: sensor histidine kinase [Dehalococcoidia bacterium]|nr:sensor histidine kinase [Dehalococcoidia bacterium]
MTSESDSRQTRNLSRGGKAPTCRRKKTESRYRQYADDLATLSRAATVLAEFSPSQDIYQLIAELAKRLVKEARLVIVSSYSEDTGLFRVQAILTTQMDVDVVSRILGRDPVGLAVPISSDARTALTSGALQKAPRGIYDLAGGLIPESTAREIEKDYDFGSAYAMGFFWQETLYGSINIVMASGCDIQDPGIVETFVHQVAVALQRKQATDDLARAKNELEIRVKERTAELSQAYRQMRYYARRVTEAHEEERTHISRELHDEIGQVLSYLVLQLDHARKQRPDSVGQAIDEAKTTTIEAIRIVRDLSQALRPPMLEAGLVPALEELMRKFSEKSGINAAFNDGGIPPLTPQMNLALYRITQEALTNVIRHASASEVRINLSSKDGNIVLRIEDNGTGFDTKNQRQTTGLQAMRERASSLGGNLSVQSNPGSGTCISATFPCGKAENDQICNNRRS